MIIPYGAILKAWSKDIIVTLTKTNPPPVDSEIDNIFILSLAGIVNMEKAVDSIRYCYAPSKKNVGKLFDCCKDIGIALNPKKFHYDKQNFWKLIDCGNCFVTETEARYAMADLELLSAIWALRKGHSYLFGLPEFTLMTDHRPLVTIINKKKTLYAVDNT
ncbi:unnamed protein product [Lepeophtheirus salmonis]|uniref:(salmon louse) hypothetical protein n=1 Tax=Lepeophtheirus salmonis TaxID=72036 RepID=A0A7R8D478_LEPSM|nr:unnamed protein product [Lepeophtheirus salmonis]CAF2971137.1 unnamed protein product [Lepeophtheirus salmonis]